MTVRRTVRLTGVAEVPQVPGDILIPRKAWKEPKAFDAAARHLAQLFGDNFKAYEAGAGAEIKAAGPLAA